MATMSTEEQALLRESVRRFVERNYGFEQRKTVIREGGFNAAHWQAFAELGWLGLNVPEDFGGLGGSTAEAAVVMEELGRGLVLEPFLAVAILASQVVARSAAPEQAQALLAPMVSGESLLALAHGEPTARGRLSWVETQARRQDSGWVLDGVKSLVLAGPIADRLIVSARTSGSIDAPDGISLFLLRPDGPGVTQRIFKMVDGGRASEFTLAGVELGPEALLGTIGEAYPALAAAIAQATVGICAEAVGAMDQALWITRDYLRTRQQFGVPIGSFQALQHRMADMLVEFELARSMLARGIEAMDDPDPVARDHILSAVKAQVGRAAKFVGAQAIQLHGGIGVTEEYVIGHYFKRLTLIESAFGDRHFHLRRIAEHLRDDAQAAA